MGDEVIKIGDYIIIQKQSFKKLHKLNKPNSNVTLGRDCINLTGVDGNPYFSIFKMMPSSKKGREYRLELTDEAIELKDEIEVKTSGSDNRNIIDDGRSQKLTAAEIQVLANDANKASDIVETLISNSKTFHDKTEFSQEKYLRKKEKKYSEFIQILRPNLRLISEVMYKLDPSKIQNIRSDTLSQIMTYSNIHCEGNHLLYDSGSNGLVAAALLSSIGENTDGKLVHMHPGNTSQKQALLAMNFSEEQLKRCISVNIYSVLRQIYQGCDTHKTETGTEKNPLKRKTEDTDDSQIKVPKHDNISEVKKIDEINKTEIKKSEGKDQNKASKQENNEESIENSTTDPDVKQSEPKKPKWHYDNITASELLRCKMDSLVIACKEDPLNIFMELLPFVKPGRPFAVYYSIAEPLQQMYVTLKSQSNVAALKLTTNWMRNYQVLPERTHPEVTMNAQAGFLLTGYVLK